MLRFSFAILITIGLLSVVPANATTTAGATAPAALNGFRSAQFGMDETSVRRAIATDFNLPATSIHAGQNSLQHTDVLSVSVPNLIPGAGAAAVDYVFGYQSHDLVEVNVTWSNAADAANTPQALVNTGSILQSYFVGEGFPARKDTVNILLRNGSIILFRGTDPQGHAVALLLAGPLRNDPKTHALQMVPSILALAYVADPAKPDVFQLRKGDF